MVSLDSPLAVRLPVVLGALVVLGACGAEKNHEDRARVAVKTDPCERCIDTCKDDSGSRPVDCEKQKKGLEFLTIWDMETRDSEGGDANKRIAYKMYTYDDGSTNFLEPHGWQPTAEIGDISARKFEPEAMLGGPCGAEDELNHALHIRGGPFWSWGGGVGISLREIYERENCGTPAGDHDYCPAMDVEYAEKILDLSKWEGISLWARRGPDSQTGIRVMVGDKHVDDDLDFLHEKAKALQDKDNVKLFDAIREADPKFDPADDGVVVPAKVPKYCRRKKECGCRNHKPCSKHSDGLEYCYDPEVDLAPGELDDCGDPAEYEICGKSKCDEGHPPWPDEADHEFGRWEIELDGPALDHKFPAWVKTRENERGQKWVVVQEGDECEYYEYPFGVSGGFCYTPGKDPDPPRNEDQCGDYWFKPIFLTQNWKLYLIPFTDMHQQGWAMESFFLDLSALSVMRLTWDKGWIDYWIDDVSFYRRVD